MRTVMFLAAALGFARPLCGAVQPEWKVWPSTDCSVSTHACTSLRFCSAGAVADVRPGTEWPGLTVEFKKGPRDLTEYGELAVALSNASARAATVHLSVKNGSQQGQEPSGSIRLEPHAEGTITVRLHNMPWLLDAPLKLVGMNGYPSAAGHGTFDLRQVRSFHVFLVNPQETASFVLRTIRLFPGEGRKTVLQASSFLPFVDSLGQFKAADWPGKIHSEAELARARRNEEDWLAAHTNSPIPDADRFGGWGAGPQLKATGSFRTEKVKGNWWLVDPDGRLFFSQGIDCVDSGDSTGVTGREAYFEWLPKRDDPVYRSCFGKGWGAAHGYYQKMEAYEIFSFARANLIRKYGPDAERESAACAQRRLRAWGINTIGNWSSPQVCRLRQTPYVACLHTSGPKISGSSGWWGKFPDPFSKPFADGLAATLREQARLGTDRDPWCIGYFVDNELSWGRDDRALARDILRSVPDQPAKLACRDWLLKTYGTPAALNKAWGTAYPDWGAFLASTNLPDEALAGRDLETIHTLAVEQYFRTVRDAIRAAAPDRLYLGCRIAWGAPSIYRAAAKYCDIVSVNIYDLIPDRDLPEGSADKPLINGEFHFGALDRGLFHTGLVPTRNQTERAACYRDFVTACLKNPRYVGTHWFQWRDQPLTGRTDGENYQIGFLTVTDTPYPELVQAAREVAATMYPLRYGDTKKGN